MPRRDPAHAWPASARAGLSTMPSAACRVLSLLIVGAFGAAALTAIAPRPPAHRPVVASGRPVVARMAPGVHRALAGPPVPAPLSLSRRPVVRQDVAGQAVASVHAPTTRARPRRAVRPTRAHPVPRRPTGPWLPTGTGMWIYQWRATGGGRTATIVRRARGVGLSTLYLRTGSSHDGLTQSGALASLLQASRGTGLDVVAWDFPELRRPWHDARRLARAAHVHTGHGPHVTAVAPDIETPAEGTENAAWRVRAYLTALRRLLPKGVTILTAVPWPSRYRIADYPYATVAAHSDALVPMAYWYDSSPSQVTARSIGYLRRYGKPVQPVGQGYDGRIDVPSMRHNHLGREVPAFFRTAHANGARAVSIWSWQSAPQATWTALSRARRLFPRHR